MASPGAAWAKGKAGAATPTPTIRRYKNSLDRSFGMSPLTPEGTPIRFTTNTPPSLFAPKAPPKDQWQHSGTVKESPTAAKRPASARSRLQGSSPRDPFGDTRSPTVRSFKLGSADDVSYLFDSTNHGILPKVDGSADEAPLVSTIPDKYHVFEAMTDDMGVKSIQRAFPTRIPSARKEVLLLRNCFLHMLDEVGDPIDNFEKAKLAYTACFNELARQVHVHCVERGQLLNEIYNGCVILYEQKQAQILKIASGRYADTLGYEREIAELKQQLAAEQKAHEKRLADTEAKLQTTMERLQMLGEDYEALYIRERRRRDELDDDVKDMMQQNEEMRRILRNLGDHVQLFADIRTRKELGRMAETDRWRKQVALVGDFIRDALRIKKNQRDQKSTIDGLLKEIEDLKKRTVAHVADLGHKWTQTDKRDLEVAQRGPIQSDKPAWRLFFESFRIGVGTAWAYSQTCKFIMHLYQEKIVSDAQHDRENKDRQTMQELVYEYFRLKYGIAHMIEQHLTDFLESLHQYHLQSLRVRMFAQFCGFFAPLSQNNLNMFLHVLQLVLSSTIGPDVDEVDAGTHHVVLSRAIDIARHLFTHRSPRETARFLAGVESLVEHRPDDLARSSRGRSPSPPRNTRFYAPGPSSSPSRDAVHVPEPLPDRYDPNAPRMTTMQVVSAERFLYLVLEESERPSEYTDRYLNKLFSAADIYRDGQLDFPEFWTIVRYADPACSKERAHDLFRVNAREDNGRLDRDGFLELARDNNYGSSWLPLKKPANLAPTTINYFSSMEDEMKRSASIASHELKMLKQMNSPVAHATYQRLVYREEIFSRILEEKRDPELAWLAHRMFMIELNHSKEWRSTVLQQSHDPAQ